MMGHNILLVVLAISSRAAVIPRDAPVTPKPLPLGNGGDWGTVQCTNPNLTDASIPYSIRWAAADVETAWSTILQQWNQDDGHVDLTFVEYFSNKFHGPDGEHCEDLTVGTCSNNLECNDVDHPAGWLLMNSFISIHNLHQNVYAALTQAALETQETIGIFTSLFAPQPAFDEGTLMKELVSSLAMMISLGSSFLWSAALEQATEVYEALDKWKDVFNAQVALVPTLVIYAIDTVNNPLGTEDDISAILGGIYEFWQGVEKQVLSSTFDGTQAHTQVLHSMITNGSMLTFDVQSQPDVGPLAAKAQTVIYSQLIPSAWYSAPGGLHPAILVTDVPCSQASKATGDLAKGIMTDDTANQTHVCWNNKTYYVVNAVYWDSSICPSSFMIQICDPFPPFPVFEPLPGGTSDSLSNGQWGNITLTDLVISSYQGYMVNGNKNGYQMPILPSDINGQGVAGDFIFQNNVQTPGLFNLPICTDVASTIAALQSTPQASDKYWPCNYTIVPAINGQE